ncbi:Obtusifoliol 14-alpha demethylase [Tolypocladium ophioglossoides CBS 100239]|uniref:Obtusifoliol 14-alpha demethylase n=1 Tax=Tolypocladium ophioglossoides (strain CBS 100239) TaxID=1163406 RepID=A0A0L0N011_TOLOC|nr:Obtusifoliol 14-alpha demethylase [Tolypocladium ophioglossoides CBS 100239]
MTSPSALAAPPSWPASAWALLLTMAVLLVGGLTWRRPAFPNGAPRLLKGWPVIGSAGFFRSRSDFLRDGKAKSPGGQFSFYYGAHPIVAVSGPSARSSFYTTRGLDLGAGFAALFASAPKVDHLYDGDLTADFTVLVKRFLNKNRLEANLHHLTTDTDVALRKISTLSAVEPFDLMIGLVYQLTHRTLGSNDVAADPGLLAETLAIYGRMDASSAIEIMFPGLPTPNKLKRIWGGAKLHWVFQKIMDDRRKTGRTEPDAMQAMMDQGDSDVVISSVIIGALFAGLVNSGFNAAWILCFLSDDAHWYAEMRAEVDAVVSRHRLSADETAADILPRLSMAEWETEFPLIDLGLRDSIRVITPGASIRKNISRKDIKIGDTGWVIPNNAFAVYAMHDVHMDDRLYENPTRWDPGRYLPGREEDKKAPHAYVGWGSGLHPCLGMRFAKLEITISTAMFLAYYDFRRCDKHGNDTTEPLPSISRNAIGAKRPVTNVFLKCSPRF